MSLLPPRHRPAPDDEKAENPVLYAIVGLMSLALVAAVLAGLFLPPAFAAGLVIRGLRADRATLRYLGYALFAVWFVVFFLVGRRLMAARRPPDDAS